MNTTIEEVVITLHPDRELQVSIAAKITMAEPLGAQWEANILASVARALTKDARGLRPKS